MKQDKSKNAMRKSHKKKFATVNCNKRNKYLFKEAVQLTESLAVDSHHLNLTMLFFCRSLK